MISRKKVAAIIAGAVVFGTANPVHIEAFQPASHYALIQNVANDLNSGSVIKKAIKAYPDVAGWGAIAPDLGYCQLSQLAGYAPWADRYHYYKVGTFAKELLKEAIRSGNQEKIAFAAGWFSHVCGDLACHGIYVNPECGVYLENESTRGLHGELEKNAEPYVFSTLSGMDKSTYSKKVLSKKFELQGKIPYDLLNTVSRRVYGSSESEDTEKGWVKLMSTGLNTGIGYTYTDYEDAVKYLNKNGRKDRLTRAFHAAKTQCTNLLKQAEKGDYHCFTDRWNLDVGTSGSPISSLTVTVKTGTESGAGTDDDIYFGIELKTGETKKWLLDKSGYNDFENGDKDEYYLYINNKKFTPDSVKRVWIEKKHRSLSSGEAWYLDSFEVDVNGNRACTKKVEKWLKGNAISYFDTNWSGVTNTTEPVIIS